MALLHDITSLWSTIRKPPTIALNGFYTTSQHCLYNLETFLISGQNRIYLLQSVEKCASGLRLVTYEL